MRGKLFSLFQLVSVFLWILFYFHFLLLFLDSAGLRIRLLIRIIGLFRHGGSPLSVEWFDAGQAEFLADKWRDHRIDKNLLRLRAELAGNDS